MAQTRDSVIQDAGVLLGLLLLVLVISPQIYWIVIGYENVADWEMAVWGFYISALLWASYSFERRTFLFRWILSLFRFLHIPRGVGWCLVYSALFAAIGAYYLVRFIVDAI